MCRALRAACVLALVALVACGERGGPRSRWLVPAIDIVHLLPPSTNPGVARGADVTLKGGMRRAVSSRIAVEVDGRWDGALWRKGWWVVTPERLARQQRLLALRWPLSDTRHRELPMHVTVPAQGDALVHASPIERGGDARWTLYGGPDLPDHDVDTLPFTVPRDAELAFAVGLQRYGLPLAPGGDAVLEVVDGERVVPLWKRRLEPRNEDDARWREERVSLHAFAGRRVRLRFRAQSVPNAVHLPVFGDPVVLIPHAAATAPPGVILVSIDTLGANDLGAYGAARETSPTFDALAEEGVLFEDATSTGSYTLPSHASMLTGLWSRTHRAYGMTRPHPVRHRTLAEALQAAGFATAAFTACSWLSPDLGFRRGFEAYWAIDPLAPAPRTALPYATFDAALGWLAGHRDRPFFVFLHTYQVHWPYEPPAPYSGDFAPADAQPTEAELLRLRYHQEIRYADDQLAALLAGLEDLGLRERTLLVVTADHGEEFYEHGRLAHGYALYDEVARVPFVMRYPGAFPAGRRVAEPISLADLTPTVLDVLGLPPLPQMDGTSLLPLATGAADQLARPGVYADSTSEPEIGWTDVGSIRTRTHACLHFARSGQEECFDRVRDPRELAPLPPGAAAPGLEEARSALASYLGGAPPLVEGRPDDGGGLDPVRVQQLRALGYVGVQ